MGILGSDRNDWKGEGQPPLPVMKGGHSGSQSEPGMLQSFVATVDLSHYFIGLQELPQLGELLVSGCLLGLKGLAQVELSASGCSIYSSNKIFAGSNVSTQLASSSKSIGPNLSHLRLH